MVSERLIDIALMHVHQESVPDTEKIIDLFSTKNRRLLPRHSVNTPSFGSGRRGRGGGEPPINFSKSRGLTGPQLLEVNYWERGGDFFQGGWGAGGVAIFT